MVDIKKARETLEKYKKGKAELEKRIIGNEQWYKLRHWGEVKRSEDMGDPEPASAWLLNSLSNKHADYMDNYPEPLVLPREEGDRETAEQLSKILPVILKQQRYENTYSLLSWRKLKMGTAVTGVFWDSSALNGLGDIAIRAVDALRLYWEPGVDDIQSSRNVFVVSLMDEDALEEQYPQLKGKLKAMPDVAQYRYDESIDTTGKSVVVDWYYKVADGTATKLHYCKFVGDEILYSSEDDESLGGKGFYDHGLYPFVFDTQFPVEGMPAGYGWLDVMRDPQMYIDKLQQVILKSALIGSRPRWWKMGNCAVNLDQFADMSETFVNVEGNGDPKESLVQIEGPKLDPIYFSVLEAKENELKEISGNRDFSQGSTTSGVTAASAIAALQEAGSKMSRDMIRSSYEAQEQVYKLMIELIRQFYDEPRKFRIVGNGDMEFVEFSNAAMKPQTQGNAFGAEMGEYIPMFDIDVRVQKRNAFSTLSQNEMAKEFYSAGFFNPQMADQALACIEMMDFEGKDRVQTKIRENGTMLQQMQQMQQQMAQMSAIIDSLTGGQLTGGMQQPAQQPAQEQPMPTQEQAEGLSQGGAAGNSREAMADKARQRARATTEAMR